MRILLWHGWLLEGSGSNIYTARTAETLRASGHDVLLLCQEAHPERYPWIDATGTAGPEGPSALVPTGAAPAAGRCVLLRPQIGRLLPVFVVDEYEGFEVERFIDLTDGDLSGYLDRNVAALEAAARWHRSDVVIAGHAVPGAAIAGRAIGPDRTVAKIHGSDIEYAIRPQERYLRLAEEGLVAARAVVGASSDVLARCHELVPRLAQNQMFVVPPGVEVESFRPRPRREALTSLADLLDGDPDVLRGRPTSLDARVSSAVDARDSGTLDELARTYDQAVPDPDAAGRLRALARSSAPIVGYFGKLIAQKGVDLMLAGARASSNDPMLLVVGFGLHREWLVALDRAMRSADGVALEWLRESGGFRAETLAAAAPAAGRGGEEAVVFTGRLDHRYAPSAIAAMDVLVVPSIMHEAFGMVAIEGAAAGALPLVARHSGLAEVASALEAAVGQPGLFSFEPGLGATERIAAGVDRILAIPPAERDELRATVSAFVAREYSWQRTAERLLAVGS